MTSAEPTFIRASSLTNYVDCSRRAIAIIIAKEIKEAGYELHDRPNNIGAAVGTSTHKGAESLLTEKMKTGGLGNRTEAEQKAFTALDKEVEEGITWDKLTADKNTAQRQILCMLETHIKHIAPEIEPIALEQRFYLEIMDGFCLSGTLDVLEVGRMRDLKTGRRKRNNIFQYGAYKLLADFNGFPVTEIKEDYIPRTITPEPEIIDVPAKMAEDETRRLIKRIPREITEFRNDPDKDPGAFNANPHSALCSDRFCPAWGTEWCSAWKTPNP